MEVMPHSYTNLTTRDDSVVTKSYQGPDARVRCAREAAVLSAVAGHLPVAPVLGSSDTSLSLRFMPGVPGQELIEAALAEPVLRACGQMLRRVHAIDPSRRMSGITANGPRCWCTVITVRKTSCSMRRPGK